MQALRIVLHALRQVFGNFRQALVMSLAPLAIQAMLIVAGILAVLASKDSEAKMGWFLSVVAIALAWLFGLLWLAVRWHRFVLLNEPQGLLPRRVPILRYAGTALLNVLIMIPPALALIAIVSLLASVGSIFLAIMVNLIFSVLLYSLAIILATALPGAAIGAPQPIRTAWERLNPAGGTIILLAIIGFLASALVELVIALVEFALADGQQSNLQFLATMAVTIVAYWLSMLISLSVLTTLWGHYVEGRPLR